MNGDWVVATMVGVVLLLTGLLLIRWHVRSWRMQKNDASLEHADRTFFYRQYRRRMQTSGLIAVLGVLIAVGDALPAMQRQPTLFTLYWSSVLALTCWVILLGVGDLFATAAHSRSALSRVREKQRQLEQELAEFQSRRSNGHKSSD